jgi:hypothetical protein
LDLSGVEGLLHSIFLVLAFKAGTHWELSPEEATQLSKAVANVARHYPVAKTQKAADWSQLLLVILVLGVPRAVQSYNVASTAAPRGGPPRAMAPQAVGAAGGSGGITPPPAGPIQTPGQLDPGAMEVSHLTAGSA